MKISLNLGESITVLCNHVDDSHAITIGNYTGNGLYHREFRKVSKMETVAPQDNTAILHLKEIYNRLRYETPLKAFDYAYDHSADIDVLLLTDAKQQ